MDFISNWIFFRILLSFIRKMSLIYKVLSLGNLSSVPLNDECCMSDLFDGSLFSF